MKDRKWDTRECSFTCTSKKSLQNIAMQLLDSGFTSTISTDQTTWPTNNHHRVSLVLSVQSSDPDNQPAWDIQEFLPNHCKCCITTEDHIVVDNLKRTKCVTCNKTYHLCEPCSYHKITPRILERQIEENRDKTSYDLSTLQFCSLECYNIESVVPSSTNNEETNK